MGQIEKLLKYQEADEKLLKIERETSGSEERKNFAQAKNFLTKAPEKLDSLEAKALELKTLAEQLVSKYEKIAEELSDYENLDELVDGGADISFYKKSVLQLTETIKKLKNDVAALNKAVKDSEEEYQVMKKKTIAVQKQFKEYSEVYKAYKESNTAAVNADREALDALAKGIEAEVLNKYNEKRSERIFPILCAVKGGRCSKCGNELSLAGKERIENGKVTECENCHRILFKE